MSNPFPNLTTSITWNGADLRDYGLEAPNPIEGRGMPRTTDSKLEVPTRHGQMFFSTRLAPRVLRCRGTVWGTDKADALQNIESLKKLFRHALFMDSMTAGTSDLQAVGTSRLVFHDDLHPVGGAVYRYWPVRYGGVFQTKEHLRQWRNSTGINVDLTFVCDTPFALDLLSSWASCEDAAATRPIDRSIRLALGTAPSKPVIEVFGPATNPSVTLGSAVLHVDETLGATANFTAPDLVTDGNMEAAGVAQWTTQGAPTEKAKSANFVSDGAQSLKIDGDDTEGAYQAITVTPGDDYTVLAHYFSQGDDVIGYKLQLWDVTNAAEIFIVTGASTSIYFKRLYATFEAPAGCVQIQIRLMLAGTGVGYYDEVHMWDNLVVNPSAEGAWGGGMPVGWTKVGTPTITEEASANSGSKAIGIEDANNTSNCVRQAITLTSGKAYEIRLAARRISGTADLRVIGIVKTYPRAWQWEGPETGPGFKMMNGVAYCHTSGAVNFSIHQTASGTKHIIDDFSVVELTSGAATMRKRRVEHGYGHELPDAANLPYWDTLDFTSDEWTIGARFIANWADVDAKEIRDLLTLYWAEDNHWIRIGYTPASETVFAEHYFVDGSDTRVTLFGDLGCFGYGVTTLNLVLTLSGGKLRMFIDGIKQASAPSSSYQASTAYATIIAGGAQTIDHLYLLSRGVSDVEGSNLSGCLTPFPDDRKTLLHTGNLVAGDILTLDYQKETAEKHTASAITNVLGNISGDWGELKPDTDMIRLATTAGGMRVRWRKRYL